MSSVLSQYRSIEQLLNRADLHFSGRPELARAFRQCLLNTLETTVQLCSDGTTFVITGDIPALWLRDSSAQVYSYIPLAAQDKELRRVISGLIRRQTRYILIDPYANSFNLEPSGAGHRDVYPKSAWVWERKFELDSLCYPLRLAHAYWKATGDTSALDGEFEAMLECVLGTLKREQDHEAHSEYRFERASPLLPSDTLEREGRGSPTAPCGLIWSGFRPSDDACTYHYLIPANMFAVVALEQAAELAREVLGNARLAQELHTLSAEVDHAIAQHGTLEHPRYGRIYAYETDGLGHHLLMDDANVPSLLSLPYLGYGSARDEVYQNTRRFVLSRDNPYFFSGRYARGVGSPHTPRGMVWPIALAMQGLTALEHGEREELLAMLLSSTADTGFMHESVDPNQPQTYTRPWFAWANTLFAELVMVHFELYPRAIHAPVSASD